MSKINTDFVNAFHRGLEKMEEASRIEESHWYPCGFAWVAIKIRKNGALSYSLKELGFRWDDYRKHYYWAMPYSAVKFSSMSQSMAYRARCLQAITNELNAAGFYCNVETRVD
jgi:hypothetical protein